MQLQPYEYQRLDLDVVKAIVENRLGDFQRFADVVLKTRGFRESGSRRDYPRNIIRPVRRPSSYGSAHVTAGSSSPRATARRLSRTSHVDDLDGRRTFPGGQNPWCRGALHQAGADIYDRPMVTRQKRTRHIVTKAMPRALKAGAEAIRRFLRTPSRDETVYADVLVEEGVDHVRDSPRDST